MIVVRCSAQESPLYFPVSIFTGQAGSAMDQRTEVRKLRICTVRIRRTTDSIRFGRRQLKEYVLASYPKAAVVDSPGRAFVLLFSRRGDEIAYDQQFGTDSGLSFISYTTKNQPKVRQSVHRNLATDPSTGTTHLHTTIERTTYHAWGTRMQHQRTTLRNHPADTCGHQQYPRMLTRMTKQNRRRITYTRLSRKDDRFDRYATATIATHGKRSGIRRSFITHSRNINSIGKPKRTLRQNLRKAPAGFGALIMRSTGWSSADARQRGLELNAATADNDRLNHDSADRLQIVFYRQKDNKGEDLFRGYTEKQYDANNRVITSLDLGRGPELRQVITYRYDAADRLTGLDVWNLSAIDSSYGKADSAPTRPLQLNSWQFFYNSAAKVIVAERKGYGIEATTPGVPDKLPLPLRFLERFEFAYNDTGEMDMFTTSRQKFDPSSAPALSWEAYELLYEYCPAK